MRSKFWPLRDIPVVFWLVALVVVTVAHPFMAASGWLMIHLLLLGAVTHSIVVWSNYFAETLLHAPTTPNERRNQSWRLIMLNGGVLLVVTGVPNQVWALTLAGACLVAAAVAWHGASLVASSAGRWPPGSGRLCATTSLLRPACPSAPGWGRAWPTGSPARCTIVSPWRTSWSTCSAGWV